MIEERIGARLPLASLFQSATIAELARMIDEQSGSSEKQTWASVVPMRTHGERAPFFLVDVVAGMLIGYHALVEGFPESVPLYGLHAPGVDGSRLPISTIEGLAAHYIEEIRGVQPHGPYFFGGFCFAGVVAYEMARQLAEQGEELGMVALIDAYPRGTRAPAKTENRRIKLEEFRDGDFQQRTLWIRERLIRLRARLYFRSGYYALDVLTKTGLPAPRRPWNLVHVASSRAAKLYSPPPSGVRIDYFRPQTAPDDSPTPWHPLARGGVTLHQVIGPEMTHENITKGKGAPTLIEYLAPALEAAMDAAADGAAHAPQASGNGNGNGNGNGVAEPLGSLNGASER